jgi:hypothetical protein
MLQAGMSQVRNSMRLTVFINFPNPSGGTRPGLYSTSNRNEYQKKKNNIFDE